MEKQSFLFDKKYGYTNFYLNNWIIINYPWRIVFIRWTNSHSIENVDKKIYILQNINKYFIFSGRTNFLTINRKYECTNLYSTNDEWLNLYSMLSTVNIVEYIYIQWILNNKFSYKKKMKIREIILYYYIIV